MPRKASDKRRVILVLGGARSGKSRFAQDYAERHWKRPVYLATAEISDDEMAERIRLHQRSRGRRWATRECPIEIAALLGSARLRCDGILVDCLTIWLSNVLLKEGEKAFARRRRELISALKQRAHDIVLVSNEVGMGVVPPTPLGRTFRDLAGWLNQAVAAEADAVVFVVAGLPMVLKGMV